MEVMVEERSKAASEMALTELEVSKPQFLYQCQQDYPTS